MHSLGLLPVCQPATLIASRHPCSLSPRWLIPAPGRGCDPPSMFRFPTSPISFPHRPLAGAAPSSQAASALPPPGDGHLLPTVAHPLGLLPLRQPASFFPL